MWDRKSFKNLCPLLILHIRQKHSLNEVISKNTLFEIKTKLEFENMPYLVELDQHQLMVEQDCLTTWFQTS